MISCFFNGLADNRNVEFFTNYFSNFMQWFICNSMISRSTGTFFKRQPVELSYVDTVNGRPTVEPISNVSWYTLLCAVPISMGIKPWSPLSWTEGGRRITDEHTSFEENEAVTSSARALGILRGFALSCSVATRLLAIPKIPAWDVTTKGRLVPSRAVPSVWTAIWSFFLYGTSIVAEVMNECPMDDAIRICCTLL